MLRRWMIYLTVLVGSLTFFVCYRQWFSWLTLLAVLGMPVLSLVCSLPAMLLCRMEWKLPKALHRGVRLPLGLEVKCPLATPVWSCRIFWENRLSGEKGRLLPQEQLPTNHCGQVHIVFTRCRVYDYLGLFWLPLRGRRRNSLLVRPVPEPGAALAEGRRLPLAWKPKAGGGFSENHELRLYRPGDSLRQIHWKASGKTGKLILREPMEPARRPMLKLELSGTPEEMDSRLGVLLYRANQLLESSVSFTVCQGQRRYAVTLESDLTNAIDGILSQAHPAKSLPPGEGTASR